MDIAVLSTEWNCTSYFYFSIKSDVTTTGNGLVKCCCNSGPESSRSVDGYYSMTSVATFSKEVELISNFLNKIKLSMISFAPPYKSLLYSSMEHMKST